MLVKQKQPKEQIKNDKKITKMSMKRQLINLERYLKWLTMDCITFKL